MTDVGAPEVIAVAIAVAVVALVVTRWADRSPTEATDADVRRAIHELEEGSR